MITEKIEIVKIMPSQGHVLTNGREYAPDYMYLGKGAKLDDWYEITEETYKNILKEEELITYEGIKTEI